MEKTTNSQEVIPEWIRPDFSKEKGEIKRVVQGFLGKDPSTKNINEIIQILENSDVIDLSDSDWESLENTDSFHNVKPGQIDEARRICDEYNEPLSEENKRDFDKILNGFRQGNKMECPTILKNKEGKLHLISGNTRLMISRALGIWPKVIIGQLTDSL